MILPKTFSFQNIQINLNSMTWMTLKPLGVIFQALNLCSLNDLNSLNNLNGLDNLDSLISSKNLLILMVGSFLAPKWPILVPFCGIDHQKSNFSQISDTFSVGGCWGQPMLLFWKVVDETQMVKPPEPTIHHNSEKYLILLPLRAIYFRSFHYETPCMLRLRKNVIKVKMNL